MWELSHGDSTQAMMASVKAYVANPGGGLPESGLVHQILRLPRGGVCLNIPNGGIFLRHPNLVEDPFCQI
jgi:hypothetical protein